MAGIVTGLLVHYPDYDRIEPVGCPGQAAAPTYKMVCVYLNPDTDEQRTCPFLLWTAGMNNEQERITVPNLAWKAHQLRRSNLPVCVGCQLAKSENHLPGATPF